MNRKPPILAVWLVSILSNHEERFAVVGDFNESYNSIAAEHGLFRAYYWYWSQLFRSIPSLVSNLLLRSAGMYRNYFMVAVRTIKKQKTFSFINIAGLAVAVASCLLLFLYVLDEFTYDSFHENSDSIFYVTTLMNIEGRYEDPLAPYEHPLTKHAIGPALKETYPEVLDYVRIYGKVQTLFNYDNNKYMEGIYFADPWFFEFFTFPLLYGDPETALHNPFSIVISERMAEKYFGKEYPIGKVLSLKFREDYIDYIVTGVTEPIPNNSSLQFDFLTSFDTNYSFYSALDSWEEDDGHGAATFLRLQTQTDVQAIESNIMNLVNTNIPDLKNITGYGLTKLSDVHFRWIPPWVLLDSRKYKLENAYFLISIGLFILLIALFNYINLSIGKFSSRVQEVAIRQSLGAHKTDLLKQYWFETILICSISLVIGYAVTKILLPYYNTITNKSLTLNMLSDWQSVLFFTGIIFITGSAAGSYPALIYSRLHAKDVFQKRLRFGGKNVITVLLVTAQFTLSIFFITITLIVNQQYTFLLNKNLGFKKELLVTIPLFIIDQVTVPRFSTDQNYEQNNTMVRVLKQELIRHENIIAVTGSHGNISGLGVSLVRIEMTKDLSETFAHYKVDYEYLETYGITLLEGRNFSRDFTTDPSHAIIVNESFVILFNLSNPLGTKLSDLIASTDYTSEHFEDFESYYIIGVVKDFHYHTLSMKLNPAFMGLRPDRPFDLITIRMSPDNIQNTLSFIENQFRSIAPEQPFSYSFKEDDIARQYLEEEQLGNIINYSSFLAILLACAGLFGLTLLKAARRTKEIGIRKVHGASVTKIVLLISREFLVLVIVANVIAWPMAYVAMNKWLERFAYKIPIEPGQFILAGLIGLGIALLTVSSIAFKAATANPVDALRHE